MLVRSPRPLFLLAALAALLTGPAALAQSSLGKIAGRVTDSFGEPLPGATVVIDGTTQGASTDIDGYYYILQVRTGVYTLRASYVGFASTLIEGVDVEVDRTSTVDVQLEEAVVEGTEVVVQAERPLVEVARTTTTSVLDAGDLQELPVINIQDAINLQAGVNDGHFRGGRTGEVAYLVNGVPITNAFDGQQAFEVEQNMVESLEVISGVFNAEYGQALSGVVNITTKGVPREWTGRALGYVGSLASTRELEFVSRAAGPGGGLSASDFERERVSYLDAAAFPNLQDYQLSVGGPLLRDRLGFQLSGRYLGDNSYYIGRELFAPSDSSAGLSSGGDPSTWTLVSTGDGDFVPMNATERYSLSGNVSFDATDALRVSYDGFYQAGTYTPYQHDFKYVPGGLNRVNFLNHTHILAGRYTFGAAAFANLSYSFLFDDTDNKLYDTLDDPRYVTQEFASLQGLNAFQVGGNELFTAVQRTQTHTVVGSYTHQLNRVHLMKTGFQARLHDVGSQSRAVTPGRVGGPAPSLSALANASLDAKPTELAVYAQDKIELGRMIVNAGLRFDYFDPDYDVPVDWTQASLVRIPDPASPGDSLSNRRAAEASYQLSPRFGIAFPISATGVLRFSAGLFFQVPEFSLLYANPEYATDQLSNQTQFGNAELEPERTLAFELGLQQGLTEGIGVEATIFAKDVRSLVGQEIFRNPRGDYALRWINADYGNIRGFTLSLFKRGPTSPLSGSVDYTFQFAQGTASDPGQAFSRFQDGLPPILTLTRLDWDRRHVLNATLTYALSEHTSITGVGRLQSGAPYTTVRGFVRSPVTNNATRPLFATADLRAYYRVPFLPVPASLFLQVQNLFDAQIQQGVYADSGRADETIQTSFFTQSSVGGLNSVDEYYYRQEYFGAPRRVSLGLQVSF